jgi:NADP oxidoreductase coenzyme F420-dependent
MKIAILGTGMVGNALATKLVQLGHQVMMGSRIANSEAGQEWLRSVDGKARIGTFAAAAGFGEIVLDCTKRGELNRGAAPGRHGQPARKNSHSRRQPAGHFQRNAACYLCVRIGGQRVLNRIEAISLRSDCFQPLSVAAKFCAQTADMGVYCPGIYRILISQNIR